jgi:DNA polymerase III alpha subunit
MYETVIFPQVYEKYQKLLFDQRPLIVYGKVVEDNGALTVEVSRVDCLRRVHTPPFRLNLTHKFSGFPKSMI